MYLITYLNTPEKVSQIQKNKNLLFTTLLILLFGSIKDQDENLVEQCKNSCLTV